MIGSHPELTRSLQPRLVVACVVALLVMWHNFVAPLLPDAHWMLPATEMQPETPGITSHAYAIPFERSGGDSLYDAGSRVTLFEDGRQLVAHMDLSEIRSTGHGYFSHQGDRLVFSSLDNTDPRTNGRDYDAYYPVFYRRSIGYAATFVFFAALGKLISISRHQPAPAPEKRSRLASFRWQLLASAALLLLGLYCSTGTLAPYANYGATHQEARSEYLYNPDHLHFKVLFQFLDGQPRSVWNGAIFLRRILFPVLAYPFMKIWGFEIGGTVASLVINVAGFAGFVLFLRRAIGDRGAALAAWLLALYPGAAYWGGLPYVYSIIFPASLLLTAGLWALDRIEAWRPLALVSLAMGVAYLGYDLIVFFLPASIALLCWRRRFADAIWAAAMQALPLFTWLMILRHGLHQSLETSNSAAYRVVLGSYFHVSDYAQWWRVARTAPAIGLRVFFGSNFLFLPVLFLLLLVINALTSRIRLHPVEVCLLGSGAAIFVFNNLAPVYFGPWILRGPQFARLYQPIFPALVLFAARWFQALPRLTRRLRWGAGLAIVGCSMGNFLIVYGPILDDPMHLSAIAFHNFTRTGESDSAYDDNLQAFGRYPLGFHSRPVIPAPP